jgi:DNA end-binding protein Ku
MERTERAGIATFVMRGKEYLVAITAENGILSADTLRFKDEIRSSADVGLPQKQKPGPTQVRSFERLIGRRSRKTLPAGALRDQASERLLKIIKRKQASRENVVEAHGDEKPEAPVIDLFEALRQSMGKLKRSSPRSARRGKSGGNATRRKAAGVLA